MIIFFMGSDEIPPYSIIYPHTYCSIMQSNAYRPKRCLTVNTLEVKARVIGVHDEKFVSCLRLFLYITWLTIKAFTKSFCPSVSHSIAKPPSSVSPSAICRRIPSARRSNPSCTRGWLRMVCHSRSSASSSSIVLSGTTAW